MKNMIQKIVLNTCVVFALTSPAYALEKIEDSELTEVTGQAGADLSLKLTLNHDTNAKFVCDNKVYCRLGISLNNRYHDGSQDTYNPTTGERTISSTGRQQWLVMKGIQGTINIQELKLDGVDVTYGSTTKGAIKLGFTATKPIEIRNLGFQSLALETDTTPCADGNCPTNVRGYLVPATTPAGWAGYDQNNERGFMGLNMNGNLAINGSIKVFSCAGNARC